MGWVSILSKVCRKPKSSKTSILNTVLHSTGIRVMYERGFAILELRADFSWVSIPDMMSWHTILQCLDEAREIGV